MSTSGGAAGSAQGGSPSSSGGFGGSAGGETIPRFCSLGCTADEVCDRCHVDAGRCEERPSVCEPSGVPACGCDGVVYPSVCEVARAGLAVYDQFGGPNWGLDCETPEGMVACEGQYCPPATHACRDMGDGRRGGGCVPFVEDCEGTPACDCVTESALNEFQDCFCSERVQNGLAHIEITCVTLANNRAEGL